MGARLTGRLCGGRRRCGGAADCGRTVGGSARAGSGDRVAGAESEELKRLLQDIYDPASPNFHHYITPQEFAQRFGPAEADYQAVMAFARSNGLEVTTLHPNRLVLDVRGRVADIERAFHLTLRDIPASDRGAGFLCAGRGTFAGPGDRQSQG